MDVMVQIHNHYVPTDFMVLDMGEEECDPPIVLGRPFLNTTQAIIYMRSGEVHFQFPSEKVRYYFNSYTTYEQPKKNRSRRRCRLAQHRKNQLLNNKEEEPVKDKSPTSRSTLSTKHVWKEKGSSSSSPSQEVQPGSHFRPSDAPWED
jgi:hypothetical protein